MPYHLTLTARRDFYHHLEYAAEYSQRRSELIETSLLSAFELLGGQPLLGHKREDFTDQPILFWTVGRRYTIAYDPRPSPIEILRIFGAGQDVAAQLRR